MSSRVLASLPEGKKAPAPDRKAPERKMPVAISSSPGTEARTPSAAPSPTIAMKRPISIAENSPGITRIVTSKEWVLPARPKPGRKPSVDTPVTKRKAQNRAAQRAFRERRATRVQELEEKLAEFEKDRELKELGYVNTIQRLKLENASLNRGMEELRRQIGHYKGPQGQPYVNPMSSSFAAYQATSDTISSILNGNKSPASNSSIYSSYQQISPAPSSDAPSPTSVYVTPPANLLNLSQVDDDCGACVKDDCVCETIGIKKRSTEDDFLDITKPRKRKLETEVDFTAQFSTKKTEKSSNNTLMASFHGEAKSNSSFDMDCGFCSDDTPCVCREAAKEALQINRSLSECKKQKTEMALPPLKVNNNTKIELKRKSSLVHLPVLHPGPSVEFNAGSMDASVAKAAVAEGLAAASDSTPLKAVSIPLKVASVPLKAVSLRLNEGEIEITSSKPTLQDKQSKLAAFIQRKPSAKKEGCTGDPGTCSLCQIDPMSTLFCTTIATKNSSTRTPTAPVPKPTEDAKIGLTEILNVAPRPNIARNTSAPLLPALNGAAPASGVFIPVPDAYRTLSRHENFDKMDFNYMVGKLTTKGMSVDVGSVANLLRELDRRLYN
ncbi:hypothetical protein BABINDRAFT_163545 [Babjeviella inositovora NRRL Y-12698]|uniref:BZIP domain-containing protein n=1 Tax=Babjeviella inositovora NRRL Y-12698 TaxID=984486 RepID=A0A1E3QIL6_9ASCO|nr:uncharacterized protein BABINDRAFT_163545 [Babjeviella inositovora NRRL Y-12698]ODQ77546.1 hypothetical protein BABINDRAFT_163545 [Babjeviella inositovora NRRL Y-12698]